MGILKKQIKPNVLENITIKMNSNNQPKTVISSASEEKPFTYGVNFLSGSNWEKDSRRIAILGNGELAISADAITLSGKQNRFGFHTDECFPLDRILNVVAAGKQLQFDIENPPYDPVYVSCTTISDDEIGTIEALLPKRRSEVFVKDQADAADFEQRIDLVSPHTPVTVVLIVLNVTVFLAMCFGGAGIFNADPAVAIKWGSNFGPLTLNGQWWRLITATFMHFGILHLTLNMLALYQAGRLAERMFGSSRFLLLYSIAGISGGLVSLLWNADINSAGASGAIFGVLGGLLAFTLNAKNAVPISVIKPYRNGALVFIALNLLYGFRHAGIDNAAHIGGLIAGLAVGYLLVRPLTESVRKTTDYRSLALALFVSLAAWFLLANSLLKSSQNISPEAHFKQVFAIFSARERIVIADTVKLSNRMKDNQRVITPLVAAGVYERDILPAWEALYKLIDESKLESQSPDYPFRSSLLQYLNDRALITKTTIGFLRSNNPQLLSNVQIYEQDMKSKMDEIKNMRLY